MSHSPNIITEKTHPLVAAALDLAGPIAASAETAERERRVSDSMIEQLSDAGFFRCLVPKEYGGDEVNPLVVHDALGILGAADCSTAWVAMIIFANPLFFGNAVSETVWSETYGRDPDLRTAGTVAPGGKAVAVDGGYRVTGRWGYGSGSEHCSHLISGCIIHDGDSPRIGPDGNPVLRWILHSTEDCAILKDSWDTTGLCGSGSFDYTVKDLYVPEEWTFILGDSVNPLQNPMYGFPGLPFCLLSGMVLGMADTALRFVRELAQTKRQGPVLMRENPGVQMRIAEAEVLHGGARAFVRECTQDILDALHAGAGLTPEQRGRYRLATSNSVDSAARIIDMMYKVAGGAAISRGVPLERLFRDIHTAQTHIQFNDLTYIKSARLLLGLDPEDILF